MNLLPHELIIDNFAGGGGTSTGLEQAFGRPVDIAINHDPKALAMHRVNHPTTKHFCESVWDIDPIEATGNQPVGLVWLSPDCKHFSKAKGGKPVEKRIRGLAWVALRWASKCRPRVIMLENVEEFKTWGALGDDGRPCPIRKGQTFAAFVRALERQGYRVEHRELRACDFGAPTIRKRFFLIARRDGLPIFWPVATHGDPSSKAVKTGQLKPWRTAAECIDFTLPCPSIFDRSKPLADATCKRIATGIMRYVVNSASPYIVKANHTASYYKAFRGQSIDEPLQTVTQSPSFGMAMPMLAPCVMVNNTGHAGAAIDKPLHTVATGGNHGLVSVFINTYYGQKRDGETRGIDVREPLRTQTTENRHGVAAVFLAKNYTGVIGCPVSDPVHTVTAQDHHSLVTSNLIKLRNGATGQTNDEPLPTLTAGGLHVGEVRAFLTAFYGSDKDGQPVTSPLRTIATHDKFGLVTVAGQTYQIADIGFRMLQPHELFTAQGFPADYIITHGTDEHGQTIKLSKADQTRMCGNSVCPPVARALVEANFQHEQTWMDAV
jgi:DNA (cytosine-5)-methyltransferase 1